MKVNVDLWKIFTLVLGILIMPLAGWVWQTNLDVAEVSNDLGDLEQKVSRVEKDVEEYEDRDIDPGLLRHIIINLAEYKKKNNLLDFNDMIKRFVNKPGLCPNFDAVFIDEAQDLSPLQWMMYDILKTKTDNIYLAGDDDQAIFQWAGADVTRFIKEPGTQQILTQSRRIPKSIQELSKVITERIQGIKV